MLLDDVQERNALALKLAGDALQHAPGGMHLVDQLLANPDPKMAAAFGVLSSIMASEGQGKTESSIRVMDMILNPAMRRQRRTRDFEPASAA
jgi:hypothetical protein